MLCFQHSFNSEGRVVGPISRDLKMGWVPNLVGVLGSKVLILISNMKPKFDTYTKL